MKSWRDVFRLLCAGVLAFLSISTGCGPRKLEASCESDNDCPRNAYCYEKLKLCFELPGSPDFAFEIKPRAVAVKQGSEILVAVELKRGPAYSGHAVVQLLNAPEGVSASVLKIASNETSGVLRLQAAEKAAVGRVKAKVTASAGGYFREGTLDITVNPLGSVSVEMAEPEDMSYANKQIKFRIVTSDGAPDSIELFEDGRRVKVLEPSYETIWNVELLSEGEHEYTARATSNSLVSWSAPRAVIVDRTAPVIRKWSPILSESISIHQPIRISISEPVNPDSVNNETLKVVIADSLNTENARLLENHWTLAEDNKQIVILPSASDLVPARFGVKISGITDYADNPIADKLAIYEVPLYLRTRPFPNVSLRGVALAVDSRQRLVLATSETHSDIVARGRVYVRRWVDGAWELLGGPMMFEPIFGQGTFDVHVNTNGNGEIFVAWQERPQAGAQIHLWKWDGADWNPVGEPLPGIVGSLAISASGMPLVSSVSKDTMKVWSWTGSEWLSFGNRLAVGMDVPLMIVGANGKPIVAYRHKSGPYPEIEIAQSIASANFKFESLDAEFTKNAKEIALIGLVVNGEDRVSVAWKQKGEDDQTLLRVARRIGGTWRLMPNIRLNSFNVRAEMRTDREGRLVLVFSDLDTVKSCGFKLFLYRSDETGGVWADDGSNDFDVFCNAESTNDAAALFSDQDGRFAVAWVEAQVDGRSGVLEGHLFSAMFNR